MIHSALKLYTTVGLFLLCVQGAHASRSKRFMLSQPTTQTIDTGPYHWSQWSSWSSCNGTCHTHGGLGQQSRSRYCDDGINVVKLGHCRKPYTHHSGDDDVPLFRRDTQDRDVVVLDDGPKASHSSHNTLYDYQSCIALNCPVNGGWSLWSNYSSCSVPSGHGHMTRYRLCNNPTPVYGGHNCIGSSSESKPCTVNVWSTWSLWIPCSVSCGTGMTLRSRHCTTGSDCIGSISDAKTCMETPCARNGGWSDWTEFAECSLSCGNGVTFRTRQCNNPFPENGGLNCTGSSQEFKACNRTCPTDGGWSDWTEFAECSLSCGNGVTFRTRQCNNPFPENGGLNCTGSSQEFKACKRPCPIDGGWTSYQNMSCSATCGTGVMTSFRTCTNPAPENGGQNCTGQAYTFKHCKLRDCADLSWSTWSNWSDCSNTCGNGTQTRTRQCSNPQNGGLKCLGPENDSKTCNLRPCPIDGGWSEYRNLSCSATCGKGTILAYRACNNPVPQYGGKDCVGLVHQIHECNMVPCKIDGSWGSWSNWTECSTSCGNGTQIRTRQCDSPSPQNGGQNCTGKDIETQNCFIKNCSIDGNWSEWTLTGKCGPLCGDGYATRYRICSNPAPENGGHDCTGNPEERVACNSGPCPADVPVCDKTTVMETLKTHALFAPTRAGPCSNMDYIPEENMLKDLCGAPTDTNMWGVSRDVRMNCGTIPLYSPVAKVHRLYKIKNYGILLDCYQSKLKFATETCEDGVHEQDISLDIEDDWDYFTMTW